MPALAFVSCSHNLNSIAVLTGALERDARTATLPLHFLWQDEQLLPRLRALADDTDRLALALSFTTAELPNIAGLISELRTLGRDPFIVAGGIPPLRHGLPRCCAWALMRSSLARVKPHYPHCSNAFQEEPEDPLRAYQASSR